MGRYKLWCFDCGRRWEPEHSEDGKIRLEDCVCYEPGEPSLVVTGIDREHGTITFHGIEEDEI